MAHGRLITRQSGETDLNEKLTENASPRICRPSRPLTGRRRRRVASPVRTDEQDQRPSHGRRRIRSIDAVLRKQGPHRRRRRR